MIGQPKDDVGPVTENPFFHRKPIQDRQYFFGRVEETQRALDRLRNSECVSIFGPRRIGKSSLLFHLCDREVQREHGLGEEYAFVHINCEGLGNIDKAQFYQLLWEEIKRALAGGRAEHWGEGISDFPGFREALNTVQRRGYKLALFFDEFETIAQNPNFDQDLFSDLRSLVSTSTLVYATASQDALYDLTYVGESALSSPFFNVFTEIPLGFLKPREAEEMVRGLLRIVDRGDLFIEEDLDFVFDAGGYFPFFLQLVCDRLFEQKAERKDLTAPDYESVRQQYAVDAEPHFHYMWRNLDAGEREAVQLVCEGKVNELTEEQKQRLERKCVLYNNAIFCSVFAEFVQRQAVESGTRKTRRVTIRGALDRLRETFVGGPRLLYKQFSDKYLDWLRKAGIAFLGALFVSSAIITWPDLPDLALMLLKVENVKTMNLPGTAGETTVKVYSPKLLLIGQTDFIKMETYGSEEPEFKVIANPRSDVVIEEKKKGVFEIECKGTDDDLSSRMLRSRPITLSVDASVPAGASSTNIVVRTSSLLSLFARLGILLSSGCVGVKRLWTWLRGVEKSEQGLHSA